MAEVGAVARMVAEAEVAVRRTAAEAEALRRRRVVANLIRAAEALEAAAAIMAAAADIGGIRSTAVLGLRQRLLKAGVQCLQGTSSQSPLRLRLPKDLRRGTIAGRSRRARRRARRHA